MRVGCAAQGVVASRARAQTGSDGGHEVSALTSALDVAANSDAIGHSADVERTDGTRMLSDSQCLERRPRQAPHWCPAGQAPCRVASALHCAPLGSWPRLSRRSRGIARRTEFTPRVGGQRRRAAPSAHRLWSSRATRWASCPVPLPRSSPKSAKLIRRSWVAKSGSDKWVHRPRVSYGLDTIAHGVLTAVRLPGPYGLQSARYERRRG